MSPSANPRARAIRSARRRALLGSAGLAAALALAPHAGAQTVITYTNGEIRATPIVLNTPTTQLQLASGNASQTGVISETGGSRAIEKTGAGMIALANNSYTGGTTITEGTLAVYSASHLGSGPITLNGGVLNIVGELGLPANNNIVITAAGGTITAPSSDGGAIAGVVSGPGTLTKAGAGSLRLMGTNTFSGGVAVTGGFLQLNTGSAGTGSITMAGGALIYALPSTTLSNPILLSSNATLMGTGVQNGDITESGGAKSLLLQSANITFSGTNTYSGGTTIQSSSTLSISSDANLGAAGGR